MYRNFSGQNGDSDCFCKSQPALLLQAIDVDKKIKAEQISSDIVGLYKQMRLQQQIQETPFMDENIKQNLLYTNGRMLNSTAHLIDATGVDFPATFRNLVADQNTNIILDAMQNRSKHLQQGANNGK